MKRIFAIICACSVLLTFMIIPVAATDTISGYSPDFIDLFEIDYQFKREGIKNGSVILSEYVHEPSINLTSAGLSARFTWGQAGNMISFNHVYAAIQAADTPSRVVLNNTHEGYLVGQIDGVFYYLFDWTGTTAIFNVLVESGSNVLGTVKLISAFAVIDSTHRIDSAFYSVQGQMRSDGQYYMQTISSGSSSLPLVFDKTYSSYRVAPDATYFTVLVSPPVPYVDSLSVTFLSTNVFSNPYEQDSLTTGGVIFTHDGISESIPYIISDSVSSGSQYGHNMFLYTVTIDLEGIDLSGDYNFAFTTKLDPISYYAAADNETILYYIAVTSISYRESVSVKPWYVRFFYWIQGEFTSLKETIREAFGVNEPAPDISDQQQAAQDKIEDNKEANDNLNDLIDELEQAPDPPDFEDTGLDEFKDEVESNIQPVQPVFVVIFENPVILQMVTYVFMFALGGFLLFGER